MQCNLGPSTPEDCQNNADCLLKHTSSGYVIIIYEATLQMCAPQSSKAKPPILECMQPPMQEQLLPPPYRYYFVFRASSQMCLCPCVCFTLLWLSYSTQPFTVPSLSQNPYRFPSTVTFFFALAYHTLCPKVTKSWLLLVVLKASGEDHFTYLESLKPEKFLCHIHTLVPISPSAFEALSDLSCRIS